MFSSRYFSSRGPEARLYLACFAAIMMPVAMFIYAWSSFPFVPWVALTIGITLYIGATFVIYLAAFNYLADWWVTYIYMFLITIVNLSFWFSSYGPFASSAIAGQSLASMFYLFYPTLHKELKYNLFRLKGNLSAASFPLFTTQMYEALSFKWANTLFGCLAVILVPIPFVCVFSDLFFFWLCQLIKIYL